MQTRSAEAMRAAAVLNTLKRLRGLSDQKIADRAGVSRQAVEQRRRGRTALDFDDVSRFAEALEVPVIVFYMNQAELMTWLADQAADLQSRGLQEIASGRELVLA